MYEVLAVFVTGTLIPIISMIAVKMASGDAYITKEQWDEKSAEVFAILDTNKDGTVSVKEASDKITTVCKKLFK